MAAQLALFSSEFTSPQGLRYHPGFISSSEETELIVRIRALPLTPFQFGAYEGKRKVASFGWRYDYSAQKLEQAGELPTWIVPFTIRPRPLRPSTGRSPDIASQYKCKGLA